MANWLNLLFIVNYEVPSLVFLVIVEMVGHAKYYQNWCANCTFAQVLNPITKAANEHKINLYSIWNDLTHFLANRLSFLLYKWYEQAVQGSFMSNSHCKHVTWQSF